MLRYVVALCLLALAWAQECQVANIQVMQNFDKTKVSRKFSSLIIYTSAFVVSSSEFFWLDT